MGGCFTSVGQQGRAGKKLLITERNLLSLIQPAGAWAAQGAERLCHPSVALRMVATSSASEIVGEAGRPEGGLPAPGNSSPLVLLLESWLCTCSPATPSLDMRRSVMQDLHQKKRVLVMKTSLRLSTALLDPMIKVKGASMEAGKAPSAD